MRFKVYLLILLNHLLAIGALCYFAPSRFLIWSFVGWILIGKVGGEVGFHRFLCHRSFQTGKFRKIILLYLGSLNCFGSPISWVAIHRAHHQHSDQEKDPHGGVLSPWRVWLTLWNTNGLSPKTIVREMKDPDIRFFHDHYFKIIFFTFLLLGLYSPLLPIYFISIPAVVTYHSAGLVNVACHGFGYRNHATNDNSYNNLLVNFVTLGSGLHNNHHAYPNQPFCSEHWYEIDFPGFVIRYFLKKGPNHVA